MPDSAASAATSRLRVLLFTDVAGSVDVKRRLGDARYGRLIARHDALFRSLVAATPGGEILNDTGDGFLAAFDKASAAVSTALQFQDALAREPWEGEERLRVRIGVHQGEVQNVDAGGARAKVVGLAADVAARVMGLAAPGQILLTRTVFDDARQVLRDESGDRGHATPPLAWRAYGRYLLQGVEDPVEVHGVGREGELPSEPPPGSEKARRAVAADEEDTLGWRPASGLEIPGRDGWRLERKLGEGGFGEVWLGAREKTLERRVFKFCFDAERLRSFRREITLVKLLRSALGERPDIARLHEMRLDRPPYYLESEFTEEGDLADWAARQGGIGAVPLATRLDFVARVADAVAAAHSVGILHKDLKPSNVLVYYAADAAEATGPRPRLADFGIGILTDRSVLEGRDITASGFTLSQLGEGESSRTGTRLYAPPESDLGLPFTTRGDVYALGVLLYQMVVGDFGCPLAQGWERDVADPLLREDVAACVEGDPERRLANAADLAARLRALPSRRRARARRALVRAGGAAAIALGVLGAIAGALYLRERDLRREADSGRVRAEEARREADAARELAARSSGQTEALATLLRETFLSLDPSVALGREITVREALDQAIARLEKVPPKDPVVEASVRDTIGQTYFGLGKYLSAKAQFARARELYERSVGPDHPDTLAAANNLFVTLRAIGESAEAEKLALAVLDVKRRVLGEDDPDTITSLGNYALLVQDRGDYAEAEAILRRALAAWERIGRGRDRAAIDVRVNLADCLDTAGRFAEAEAAASEAENVAREALGEEDPSVLVARSIRASVLRDVGRHAEAETILRACDAAKRRLYGPDHLDGLTTRNSLALVLSDLERFSEAEEILRDIVARAQATLGPEHPATLTFTINLARAVQAQGRAAEAETLFRATLEIRRRTLGGDHRETLVAAGNLGECLAEFGSYAEALPLLEESAAGLDAVLPPEHWMPGAARVTLGRCLRKLGRADEARRTLEGAYARLEKTLGSRHARTRAAAAELADLFESAGGAAPEAAAWRERAKKDPP